MNKDKQSYSASDKERMFHMENNNSNSGGADNKNDRDNEIIKLYISLNKEIEKEVNDKAYEEIKQIVDALLLTFAQKKEKECEEEIERQRQELATLAQEMEKKYEEKNRKHKRNRRILIIITLILLIIVTILFEYVNPQFIWTFFLGACGSISALTAEAYFKKKKKEIAYVRKKGEPISTGIINVGIAIGQTIKEASLLHLVLLLWGTIMLGEFLGSEGAFEVAYEFAAAGFAAVGNADEDVILAIQVDEKVEEIILSGYDKKTINMLQQADITQAELNATKNLSQEDYDLVFCLNQKNLDWTDQSTVNDAVSRMIDEKLSMQMENEFDKNVNDGGAPQWLRDSVYQASEDEKTAESFNVILSIHNVRADAYEQYPKKSLANLLSNDNQKLAIILYIKGGEESSIIYYYSQSILRDFECLQFAENSDDTVKDKLISIEQRYKDMIYTCPNMENRENAQALAVAFENAANRY